MNKEDKNNHVITLPNWMARFVPHLMFTSHYLLVLSSKTDRLIFNASELYTPEAVPVNRMTFNKFGTELDCFFGDITNDIYKRI